MVWCHKQASAQELCERGGGRPGLPVTNGPYGLYGRKATSKRHSNNTKAVTMMLQQQRRSGDGKFIETSQKR